MIEQKIYIEWDGPYKYEEIIKDKEEKKGLYQIYSSHPIYGEDTLIYIGKTEQEFHKRLNKRGILTIGKDVRNIKIYLGTLYFESIYTNFEDIEFSKYLEYAETLLINYHKPAFNSSNINSFKHWKNDILVINRGNYRMLHQTVSTKGLYHVESAYKEVNSLRIELKIEEEYIYTDDECYGFYLDQSYSTWVGLDFRYWQNDTVLVIESTKNKKSFKSTKDPDWYYKPLKGTKEKIIEEIKSYLK